MLHDLDPDFDPLSDDFAAASDSARVLLVLSPT
jgi:hypothetical protein